MARPRRLLLLIPVVAIASAAAAVVFVIRSAPTPVEHTASSTDRSVEYLVVHLDPGTSTDRAAQIVQDAIRLPGGQTGTNMLLGREVFVDFATRQTSADIAAEEKALLQMKDVASVSLVAGQDPGVQCFSSATATNGAVCQPGPTEAGRRTNVRS